MMFVTNKTLRLKLAASEKETADWKAAAKEAQRVANDRSYFIEALTAFLGQNGLKVLDYWRVANVQRVHVSWGPKASALTGEQRAEQYLTFVSYNPEIIDNVDEHLETLRNNSRF